MTMHLNKRSGNDIQANNKESFRSWFGDQNKVDYGVCLMFINEDFDFWLYRWLGC